MITLYSISRSIKIKWNWLKKKTQTQPQIIIMKSNCDLYNDDKQYHSSTKKTMPKRKLETILETIYFSCSTTFRLTTTIA